MEEEFCMKWKYGKTYVYYIQDLDMIYTAVYLPPVGQYREIGHDFMTLRQYRENEEPFLVFFNPEVSAFYPFTPPYEVTRYEGTFLGEL